MRNKNKIMDNKFRKLSRPRLSLNSTKILNDVFEITDQPTLEQKTALATRIGIPIRSVQIWFQNKRAKMRKKSNSLYSYFYNGKRIYPLSNNLFVSKFNAQSSVLFCNDKFIFYSQDFHIRCYKFHDCTLMNYKKEIKK